MNHDVCNCTAIMTWRYALRSAAHACSTKNVPSVPSCAFFWQGPPSHHGAQHRCGIRKMSRNVFPSMKKSPMQYHRSRRNTDTSCKQPRGGSQDCEMHKKPYHGRHRNPKNMFAPEQHVLHHLALLQDTNDLLVDH